MKLFACLSAVVFAAFTSLSTPAAEWVWSDPVTLRFGIESDWSNSTRIDQRHTDISIYYCGGLGAPYLRAEAPPALTNIPIALAHLFANTNTREVLASVPSTYEFLGVTNNQRFWNLEQNYFANQLWLGLRGEGDLSRLADWNPNNAYPASGRYYRVELQAVRGPAGGYFSLFQWGSPPTVYLASAGGITTADVFHVAAGGHDHFNWSFTQPGLYEVDLRIGTFVNAPTGAPPTLAWSAADGTNALTGWTCDPCLRYWIEQTTGMTDQAVWTPAGPTASPPYAATAIGFTNVLPAGASPLLFRIRGRP